MNNTMPELEPWDTEWDIDEEDDEIEADTLLDDGFVSISERNLEVARRILLRNQRQGTVMADGVGLFNAGFTRTITHTSTMIESEDPLITNKQSKMTKEIPKDELKKRHLTKDERQFYHQPKNDWLETPSGEVCKSACTLVVDDLVSSR